MGQTSGIVRWGTFSDLLLAIVDHVRQSIVRVQDSTV